MENKTIVKTDGKIDLILAKGLEEYSNCFDIYLHDTNINIGNIWCDSKNSDDINYFGNVGYHIYHGYEENGCALKELNLMKGITIKKEMILYYLILNLVILSQDV